MIFKNEVCDGASASENQLTSQVEAFSWENDGTWEIRVAGASSPVS